MTDAPTLLPCAHCSSPPRAREKPNSYGMGWVIQCDACGVHTITFKDCADAVAVWNRRASPPADADDDALLDHIAFLWRTYALEDDAKLTDAAVRLKRQLIGACSPRAQPAAADEVERVASALLAVHRERLTGGIAWGDFEPEARAAIAAMRKPAAAATPAQSIVLNDDGSLDDYCGPTGFRLEDMGGHFWALDCGRYRFHIEALKRGQVRVTLFDDGAAHQPQEKRP